MISDRYDWLRASYVLYSWDLDNETVSSAWNDLQRLLKIIGNVVRLPGFLLETGKVSYTYFRTKIAKVSYFVSFLSYSTSDNGGSLKCGLESFKVIENSTIRWIIYDFL